MSFEVDAEQYDRYIGRYSRSLAPLFIDFARPSAPVLDVGCGPGGLARALVERFGPRGVGAVDPSESFVAACRALAPGVDVRVGRVERLPFETGQFQAALAQLVLSFVGDARAASAELARVVRPGGVVAACTFSAEGFDLARAFWQAARRFDPSAPDDAGIPFRTLPALFELWTQSGFRDITSDVLELRERYEDFDAFWVPFSFGIGPAGSYYLLQPPERQRQLRDACFELLGQPEAGFSLNASVLAIRGVVV